MTAEQYMAYPHTLRRRAECLRSVQQALAEQGQQGRADEMDGAIARTEREQALWRGRVLRRIARLPDESERRALTLRFVEGLSMETVASCMGYCERQVYRILRQGVAHMEALLVD